MGGEAAWNGTYDVCITSIEQEETMKRSGGIVAAVIVGLFAGGHAIAVVGGGDITMKNKGGDVMFSHEVHVVGASLACTSCHDGLYKTVKKHKKVTMKEMEKGKSCGACHNDKRAFGVKGNCASCHKK